MSRPPPPVTTSHPPPLVGTSRPTTPSSLRPAPLFNFALDAYKKRTKKDIIINQLLQPCTSANDVLTLLRDRIPALSQFQSISELLIPTVNVLHTLSATVDHDSVKGSSSADVIFTGLITLFSEAKDDSASQDQLDQLFSSIGPLFRQLEAYSAVPPTSKMRDLAGEIMASVLTILGIVTKRMKRGKIKRNLKRLQGNSHLKDEIHKFTCLIHEEVGLAIAEQSKMGNREVIRVDEGFQGVSGDMEDLGRRSEELDNIAQGVGGNESDIRKKEKAQGLDRKLHLVNRNPLQDSLLRWLSPPDPSINYNTARKACHNGTARWFFRGTVFNHWKSTPSLLWLHGKPGSGKSVLCSSIIQHILTLREDGNVSLAYFFFDFKVVNKQNLQNLLSSLLIQLSDQSDLCRDILSELHSSHEGGKQKPNDRVMIERLKEMLTQCPTYIIVDALDECPSTSTVPSPRKEVLDLVRELVGLQIPDVHICVTSRPELDIRAVLEPLTEHPVSLHDESGQKQDIADYVNSFVRSDPGIRRWREEDKELIIKILSEKVDGMFSWVSYQLKVLPHFSPQHVRHFLDELPGSLDETYERILREIRKPYQTHARRLLQCLVAAVRPLRVEELAEVFALHFNAVGDPVLDRRWEDQKETVISACSSLVTVVKDGDSRIIRFSHFSVKEYLTSHRLSRSSGDVSSYHIRLETAHTILAQACLCVLLSLDAPIDHDKIKDSPLAGYAAQFWVQHAQFMDVSSRIKNGMERLFDGDKPHFAAWLGLYDEERRKTSMPSMRPKKPGAVPLYYASRHGFYDLVENLIVKNPQDIDTKGGNYSTPLHAAAAQGHGEVTSLLLDHLAVDTRSTFKQRTPLHTAAETGQVETGQLLLERGAEVNARQDNGRTSLHLAVLFNHPDFVRLLLRHGADVRARDHDGATPYVVATTWRRRPEIIQILAEYGGKLDME